MIMKPKTGSFFRTMVLMSGSLTLGCGGLSDGDDGDTGDGSDGGGGLVQNGTGGLTGTGSAPSAGGAPSTGGSGSGGRLVTPSSGGADAAGGANLGGAFPTDCPTEQLTCSAPTCASGAFFQLPADCVCDASRPASSSDCAEGEVLSCLGASVDGNSQVLDPPIPFECACVPGNAEDDCREVCDTRAGNGSYTHCADITADLDGVLCGCAVTVLK